MSKPSILFWQPKTDYLRLFTSSRPGQIVLVILNYSIWIFLFFVSYLLIKSDINYFWRILFATIFSEFIEKGVKSKVFWRRPMFVRHDTTPAGLVDKWYKSGSFPSGHTIKATYFFLFVLQSGVMSPHLFLAVTLPLLFFRVLIGFHYPIDLLGGVLIGLLTWTLNFWYIFPASLNRLIQIIFNSVFFLNR